MGKKKKNFHWTCGMYARAPEGSTRILLLSSEHVCGVWVLECPLRVTFQLHKEFLRGIAASIRRRIVTNCNVNEFITTPAQWQLWLALSGWEGICAALRCPSRLISLLRTGLKRSTPAHHLSFLILTKIVHPIMLSVNHTRRKLDPLWLLRPGTRITHSPCTKCNTNYFTRYSENQRYYRLSTSLVREHNSVGLKSN